MKKLLFTYSLILILGVLLLSSCGGNVDTDTETVTDSDTATEVVDSSTDTTTDTAVESDTETDTATETQTDTSTDTEPHVHKIGYITAKAPTCTENGNTEGQACYECGEYLVYPAIILAKGHIVETVPAVAPSCIESGLTEGKRCSGCGEIYIKQQRVSPTGHIWENIPAIEPTCTQLGLSEGERCSQCFEWAIEQEVLPKADHNYIIHVPKEPTCTEYGYNAYQTCSSCWYTAYYERIPALGHEYDSDYVCTLCEKSIVTIQGMEFELDEETNTYIVTSIKIDSNVFYDDTHSYSALSERVETIYDDGYQVISPEDPEYDEIIDFLRKTTREVIIPSEYNGLPVTAIANNAILSSGYVYNITIPSTITRIETEVFKYFTTAVNINYLGTIEDWCNINFGYNWTNYSDTVHLYINDERVNDLVIPNTVTEIKPYQFEYMFFENVIIPSTVTTIGENAFQGGGISYIEIPNSVETIRKFALDCNIEKINYLGSVENWCNLTFEYTNFNWFDGNKELYFNGELVENIVIPDTIIEIRDYAFEDITSIKSVVISEGVTAVGASAFYGCYNLESLTIPKSLTSIGAYAFNSCPLVSVNYLGDINSWCNIEFSGTLFKDETALYFGDEMAVDLVIPSSVGKIGDYAFYGYKFLKNVTIENGVGAIGAASFFGCTSLESVSIPNSVATIENGAFMNCTKLAKISIPDSVTEIGSRAFYNCDLLRIIILPSSVTEIGSEAFAECYSLASIVIPETVTKIGYLVFYDSPNVRVFCEATEKPSEWSQDWNHTENAVFWYSEEKPTADGEYWRYVDGNIHVWP